MSWREGSITTASTVSSTSMALSERIGGNPLSAEEVLAKLDQDLPTEQVIRVLEKIHILPRILYLGSLKELVPTCFHLPLRMTSSLVQMRC